MKKLERYVEIAYKMCINKDWDEVLCICGYNGRGKTHLGFQIMEMWLRLRGIDIKPEMVYDYVGMDGYSFAQVLNKATKYGVVMDDEAGDINSRQAMAKANKLYMEAYQVIRAENLFTIIVIPDFFMLDPYFRKHRVRHLIQVTARGKCRFWSQKRLYKLNDLNSGRDYKDYNIVNPLFYDSFRIYRGVMMPEYQKMKDEKMKHVREKLLNAINDLNMNNNSNAHTRARNERMAIVKSLLDDGWSGQDIADHLGCSLRLIKGYVMDLKVSNIKNKVVNDEL